jgi:hypothetical protein
MGFLVRHRRTPMTAGVAGQTGVLESCSDRSLYRVSAGIDPRVWEGCAGSPKHANETEPPGIGGSMNFMQQTG